MLKIIPMVAFANHSGDHAIYPDCRPIFVNALNRASQLGTYNKIKIYSPYVKMNKGEIALTGLKLGIDYDKETWSCYKGEETPCGKCGTCVERIEALEWARKE
jgi:7-cyano-7-deazaguanine synthase